MTPEAEQRRVEQSAGLQDPLDDLTDGSSPSRGIGDEVDALEDRRVGVGGSGGEAGLPEGRQILYVVAHEGDLLREQAEAGAGFVERGPLVEATLTEIVERQFGGAPPHDAGAAAGHETQSQAALLRHDEAEAVPGMEALALRDSGGLVTRLEGAVGQDSVHVQQDGLDGGGPPGNRIAPASRGPLASGPGSAGTVRVLAGHGVPAVPALDQPAETAWAGAGGGAVERCSRFSRAAPMKSAKSGWGRSGFD